MILIAPHNIPISMTSDRTLRITIVVLLSSPTVLYFLHEQKRHFCNAFLPLAVSLLSQSIRPLFLPQSNSVSLRSRDATVLLLFYKRRIYQGDGQGLLMIDLDVLFWILVLDNCTLARRTTRFVACQYKNCIYALVSTLE